MNKDVLDEKFAAAQVARLAVLDRFSTSPGPMTEVMLVMRDFCLGRRLDHKGGWCGPNEQCRAVIDKAVRYLDGWRGPWQLREIYEDLFPPCKRQGE